MEMHLLLCFVRGELLGQVSGGDAVYLCRSEEGTRRDMIWQSIITSFSHFLALFELKVCRQEVLLLRSKAIIHRNLFSFYFQADFDTSRQV